MKKAFIIIVIIVIIGSLFSLCRDPYADWERDVQRGADSARKIYGR